MNLRNISITASLLANVEPTEPGVLDNYRVGVNGHKLALPNNIDQISVQEYDIDGHANILLDLFDLSQASNEVGELNTEDRPLSLAVLYGLLISIEGFEGDNFPQVIARVQNAQHRTPDANDVDYQSVADQDAALQGNTSFVLWAWPNGLLVENAELFLVETYGVECNVKVVAIGSSDDGLSESNSSDDSSS